MALELWILSGLVTTILILAAFTRLRRKRRIEPAAAERNVYPLW